MQHFFCGVLLASWFFLSGCGPAPKPTGKLSGSVTFDGTPVKDASIQLQNTKTGEAFSAKLDDGGKYSIGSITVGEYQASIVPAMAEASGIIQGNSPPPPKPAERKDIPDRYRTMKNDLKTTVKEGSNTFDAKLTK